MLLNFKKKVTTLPHATYCMSGIFGGHLVWRTSLFIIKT